MIYKILKEIVASIFKVYFRKIYLIDAEKVPEKGPILIACNHPMAFAEACLLACFLDRPLHFLVRGDVFKPRWRWFFDATNQIPIYRFRDGFSNMRRNSDTFAKAHEALANGKAILIFSEGNTKMKKSLSPLQKGTARLAFGAINYPGGEELQIVPIGVNYADGTRFQSDVMIRVGDPVSISNYLDSYKNDPHVGLKEVTDDLYTALIPQVIHLDDLKEQEAFNKLTTAYEYLQPDTPWPVVDPEDTRFVREKKIARFFNQVNDAQKSEVLSLVEKMDTASIAAPGKVPSILAAAGLVLGIPLAIVGFVSNMIPFYGAKWIAASKVRVIEFYTPVRIGLTMVLAIVWYLLCLIILLIVVGLKSLIILPILPLTGYFTVLWSNAWKTWKRRSRANSEKGTSIRVLKEIDQRIGLQSAQ